MKRLTPALRKFFEEQEILRLAYLDDDQPRALPLWFVTIGGIHYISTGTKTKKWKAIQKYPEVGWVIDAGKQGKYKGVSMYGKAEAVTDQKLRAKTNRPFGKKSFGRTDHPKQLEIWVRLTTPKRCLFI